MVAVYSGDTDFVTSTSTNGSFTVTADVTVGAGTHHGSVDVSQGSTYVVNAQIIGAVTVKKGASLDIENSTVNGAITAQEPGAIRICGTTVGGSVDVKSASGLVLVGDPGDAACAPNTINATLILQNNTGGVEAIGNQVGGLVASGNSGPGPWPGDMTSITGNTIVH
jgi:hypothetical protein